MCLALAPALIAYARRRQSPDRWTRGRAIAKTTAIAVFQPLALATVFLAAILPSAVN